MRFSTLCDLTDLKLTDFAVLGKTAKLAVFNCRNPPNRIKTFGVEALRFKAHLILFILTNFIAKTVHAYIEVFLNLAVSNRSINFWHFTNARSNNL